MFINQDHLNELNYTALLEAFTDVNNITNIKSLQKNRGLASVFRSHIYIKPGRLDLQKCFPNIVTIKKAGKDSNQDIYLISKADLIRCKDDLLRNPLRQWAKAKEGEVAKEYDVRLLATLFATATQPTKKTYQDARIHKYQHDQRVGKSKSQQFFNWFYEEGGYPGRVNHDEMHFLRSSHAEAPIIFLDPKEHLYAKLTFNKGKYRIRINGSDLCALKQSFLAYKEKDNTSHLQYTANEIFGTFQAWKKFCTFALSHHEQTTTFIREDQQRILSANSNVSAPPHTKEATSNKITALKEALLLFADRTFFDKFTENKGVLQAEQYFTWLFANIHAEISQASNNRDYTPSTEVVQEIDQLLTIRDFLLYKETVFAKPIINITKKEAQELLSALHHNKHNSTQQKRVEELELLQLLDLKYMALQKTDAMNTFLDANNKLHKKNQEAFVCILKQCSKNNLEIKISTSLRIKEVFCNLTFYMPGSSLWLKYLHPAKCRVTSKNNDKRIEETQISQKIRTAFSLSQPKGDITSTHGAKCFTKEFRKARNMMGAKETLTYKLQKHRFIWLTLCIGIFVFTTALSITSRVLITLNVITPSPINHILNNCRGATESFALIFGLDTILDLVLLRALDFVVLGVRYVDQYFLGTMIRNSLRLVTGIVTDLFHGIKHGIKECWQSLIDHGVSNSLTIASDNIKQSLSSITINKITNIPKSIGLYARNKMFAPAERSESIGFSIPVICLFYNLHRNYKTWKSTRVIRELNISCNLPCCFTENDNTIVVAKAKASASSMLERYDALETHCQISGKDKTNIGEWRKALKKLIEEKDSNNIPALNAECRELSNKLKTHFATTHRIIEIENLPMYARRKKITDTQIQNLSKVFLKDTDLLCKQVYPRYNSSDELWLAPTIPNTNCNKQTSTCLQTKVAIINTLLEKINTSKIDVAQSIAEPIFTIHDQHKDLVLGLKIYKLSLETLQHNRSDEDIKIILPLLNYRCRNYLSDAFVLMNRGFNNVQYNDFHGSDLKAFVQEFGLAPLLASSPDIKEIAANLRLYHGTSSSAELMTEHFMHFVQEYQDPKRLLLCFLTMSALQHTRFHAIPDTVSEYLHIMEDYMLVGLDEEIHSTLIGNAIHSFYEKAELARDIIAACTQTIDTLHHRNHSNHGHHHGDAITRVKGTINFLCSCFFTITWINTIKSVAAEKGYTQQETLQKCYVPYFATISVATGIPIAVFYAPTIMSFIKGIPVADFMKARPLYANTSVIILSCISAVALLTCASTAIYSITLSEPMQANVQLII